MGTLQLSVSREMEFEGGHSPPQVEPPEVPQQNQIGPRRRMRKRAPYLCTFISASWSLAEYPKRPSQMI